MLEYSNNSVLLMLKGVWVDKRRASSVAMLILATESRPRSSRLSSTDGSAIPLKRRTTSCTHCVRRSSRLTCAPGMDAIASMTGKDPVGPAPSLANAAARAWGWVPSKYSLNAATDE
ncbi:hypothetical protein D3C80_1238180 [compost metagenome]